MTSRSWSGSRWRLACLLVAAGALANSGCLLIAAGAAGGTAAYYYVKGKVCQTFHASLGDAFAATRTALIELGMPVAKEEHDALSAFVESRTADGERVRIYLELEPSRIPAEGAQTRVCVRVATFGDQWVSARILDQVSLHLAPAGMLPPQAAPGAAPGLLLGPAPISPPPPPIQPAAAPPETPPPPALPPDTSPDTGERRTDEVRPPALPGP
jgi:hypothetical protein